MNITTIPHMKPGCQLSIWRGSMHPMMITEIERFCEERCISIGQMMGPLRTKQLSMHRQELYHLLYRKGRWSLTQIGRRLGGRDHSTVLHGIRQHERRLRNGGN